MSPPGPTALVVVLVLATTSAAFATGACPPSAVVEGPSAIARPIRTLLRRHGVRLEPSACGDRVVRAIVSTAADPGSYSLRVDDGFGRSNHREVSSAETAASLIESWVFDEDADLIAPPARSRPAEVAPPPAGASTAASPAAGWLVMASGEVSAANDGSTWWGGGVFGCAPVGVLCLGGRARISRTADALEVTAAIDPAFGAELTRTAVGALALASWPLRLGRLSVWPTVGLGPEWLRATATTTFATLSSSAEEVVFRVEGGVVASVAIAGGWSLAAEVGSAWRPFVSDQEPRVGTTGVVLPMSPSSAVQGGLGIGYAR